MQSQNENRHVNIGFYQFTALYSTPPMAELSSVAAALVANATKKLREEGEAAKSRLLDQQFHISKSFLLASCVSSSHVLS